MNENYYKNERLMQNKLIRNQAGYQFCINQGKKAQGKEMNIQQMYYDMTVCIAMHVWIRMVVIGEDFHTASNYIKANLYLAI